MNYMNQGQGINLTGVTNELSGQTFTATGNEFVIGRQVGCQILINHTNISRQHTRITHTSGQWMVSDLNSANGTFINGQRITDPTPIRSGDKLGLGNYEFIFSAGDDNNATRLDTPSYQNQAAFPQTPPQQQNYPPIPASPQPNQIYTPPMPAQAPVQAPVYIPAAEPKKKRRPCLVIFLILMAVLCIGSIVAGLIFGTQIYNEVMNYLNNANIAPATGNTTSELDPSGIGSVQVNSNQGGLVTTTTGASVLIPPGAVPLQDDGQPGTMAFNMTESSTRTMTLPSDYQGVGQVYELGPEGFTFTTPVTIAFPIPDGIDPKLVLGASYYDPATDTWVMVPAAIDADNRIATVSSTHFSYWGLFSRADYQHNNWREENGGTIRVINGHRYESGTYPPEGGSKPYSVDYGVCIEKYTLDNPETAWSWTPPNDWSMTISDYVHSMSPSYWETRKNDWWLPDGDYMLVEVWHFSEVNRMVLDYPEYSNYWRTYGVVSVDSGTVTEFTYSEHGLDFNTMIEGRAPCWGIEDTSVGTGDVQITLTWEASIDLDLWVQDPNGDIVNYGNTPIPSGGALDRDNECSDFVLGRPENIYWPSGGAPSGTYTVYVDYYGSCDSSETVTYTVRTVVQGQVNTYEGTISYNDSEQTVTTFTIP